MIDRYEGHVAPGGKLIVERVVPSIPDSHEFKLNPVPQQKTDKSLNGYILGGYVRECPECHCLHVTSPYESPNCHPCQKARVGNQEKVTPLQAPTTEVELPRGMGPGGEYLFDGKEYPFHKWQSLMVAKMELVRRMDQPVDYYEDLLAEVTAYESQKGLGPQTVFMVGIKSATNNIEPKEWFHSKQDAINHGVRLLSGLTPGYSVVIGATDVEFGQLHEYLHA